MKKWLKDKAGWITTALLSAIITQSVVYWQTEISNKVDEVDYFIEHSKIEKVEVKDNKLLVTYHTAPYPNLDYRTEYWINRVDNFRDAYKLNYADTIVKNQFPDHLYNSYTRWTGDGIPLPDLKPGEYTIYIKYHFKGHEQVILHPVNFML